MGKELEEKTEHYAEAIEACVNNLREIDKVQLFSTVRDLIFKLNKAGILTVQRICFTCKYYERNQMNISVTLLIKVLWIQNLELIVQTILTIQ